MDHFCVCNYPRGEWKAQFTARCGSLPVVRVPSKLSCFNCPRILALFKATFRKPMESE
jgi:hypothetical protein